MQKKIGLTLVIINMLLALNSTFFFLGLAKTSVIEWMFFNACAPTIILYVLGYFMRSKIVLALSLPALVFFGTGGLFVFGWQGWELIAQISHIFMTLAVIWIIVDIFKSKCFKEATIGLIFAAFLVNAFICLNRRYAYRHWDRLTQIMHYR